MPAIFLFFFIIYFKDTIIMLKLIHSNNEYVFWSLCVQALAQQITDFPLPDLLRVVEQSDQVELGRLLQLILGCAVKCDRKQGI